MQRLHEVGEGDEVGGILAEIAKELSKLKIREWSGGEERGSGGLCIAEG
jgi:hypothetical protein